jgi:hypothetical protein
MRRTKNMHPGPLLKRTPHKVVTISMNKFYANPTRRYLSQGIQKLGIVRTLHLFRTGPIIKDVTEQPYNIGLPARPPEKVEERVTSSRKPGMNMSIRYKDMA